MGKIEVLLSNIINDKSGEFKHALEDCIVKGVYILISAKPHD